MSYRNTSGSLGEREMLWENGPQASVTPDRNKKQDDEITELVHTIKSASARHSD